MAKPWDELRSKLPEDVQERARARTERMLAVMPRAVWMTVWVGYEDYIIYGVFDEEKDAAHLRDFLTEHEVRGFRGKYKAERYYVNPPRLSGSKHFTVYVSQDGRLSFADLNESICCSPYEIDFFEAGGDFDHDMGGQPFFRFASFADSSEEALEQARRYHVAIIGYEMWPTNDDPGWIPPSIHIAELAPLLIEDEA